MVEPKDFIIDQSKLIKLATDLIKNIEDQDEANKFLKRLSDCGSDLKEKQRCTAITNVAKDMLNRAVFDYDNTVRYHGDHTFVVERKSEYPEIYNGRAKELTLKIGNKQSVIAEMILITEDSRDEEWANLELHQRMCSRLMFYGLLSLMQPQKLF